MRDDLAVADRDVMLVGHMPHIARLRAQLTRSPAADFPLHGAVALRREGSQWMEVWREG
jgi:hypothetical protein